MSLQCRNCGTINTDPGGDPRQYRCGYCGVPQLQRVLTPEQRRLAAGIAGAALLGAASGNPVGALIGGILGLIVGDRILK